MSSDSPGQEYLPHPHPCREAALLLPQVRSLALWLLEEAGDSAPWQHRVAGSKQPGKAGLGTGVGAGVALGSVLSLFKVTQQVPSFCP